MELVKVVQEKKYVDSKGLEHTSVNYYLVLGNTWVAIRPSFSKGYPLLDSYSKIIRNGKSKDNEE